MQEIKNYTANMHLSICQIVEKAQEDRIKHQQKLMNEYIRPQSQPVPVKVEEKKNPYILSEDGSVWDSEIEDEENQ